MMQAMIQRHEELSSSLVSLQEASVFTRFFFFIKNLNIEIFQAALHDFQPGLVLTVEGGVYALAGIAIGVGLYRLMVFVLSITILKIKELVYSQVLIKLR
jgi:hypothetical protein